MTGIGRDGLHLIFGRYAETGAAAAIRSARLHASRSVIAPPYERPVAYTRDVSTHARFSRFSSTRPRSTHPRPTAPARSSSRGAYGRVRAGARSASGIDLEHARIRNSRWLHLQRPQVQFSGPGD